LMGSVALQTHSGRQDDEVVSSPLRTYYTSTAMQHDSPELYLRDSVAPDCTACKIT